MGCVRCARAMCRGLVSGSMIFSCSMTEPGLALECRDIVGGREMSSRPLSPLRLEGLQPCHYLPQRSARGICGQARDARRSHGRIQRDSPSGEGHHSPRQGLESLGDMRPQSDGTMGRRLRRPADTEAALQDYRSERLLRTARVQLQSRELGDHVYHSSGVHALLRNQMMRDMNFEKFCDSLSWLYESPFE